MAIENARTETFYVNFINPGESPAYNAITLNYAVYWATCHNFNSSFGSREQAQQLGYPLNHSQRQETMNSIN